MNKTSVTPENLVADPAWFPHALDMERHSIEFAQIDRAGLAREAFLDTRMAGSVKATAAAPIDALTPFVGGLSDRPAFIFHTAFCCSTLMARALDIPGHSLALKEPDILMGLANAYRMAKNGLARREIDQARDLILRLLARPHQGNEQAVIKLTNTANNLAPMIAASDARIILLYGDLKGFLVSVLKKGEACKAFVRKQYTIFALDPEGVSGIPERQALGLTDLQIAALVWRHQMELFVRLLSAPDSNNLRSLDFRRLLDRPAETLKAANSHLALGAKDAAIEAAATGPVFQKNAKFDDQHYDAGARAKDEADLVARHSEELAMIENWALNLKLTTDLPREMPSPLS